MEAAGIERMTDCMKGIKNSLKLIPHVLHSFQNQGTKRGSKYYYYYEILCAFKYVKYLTRTVDPNFIYFTYLHITKIFI